MGDSCDVVQLLSGAPAQSHHCLVQSNVSPCWAGGQPFAPLPLAPNSGSSAVLQSVGCFLSGLLQRLVASAGRIWQLSSCRRPICACSCLPQEVSNVRLFSALLKQNRTKARWRPGPQAREKFLSVFQSGPCGRGRWAVGILGRKKPVRDSSQKDLLAWGWGRLIPLPETQVRLTPGTQQAQKCSAVAGHSLSTHKSHLPISTLVSVVKVLCLQQAL